MYYNENERNEREEMREALVTKFYELSSISIGSCESKHEFAVVCSAMNELYQALKSDTEVY